MTILWTALILTGATLAGCDFLYLFVPPQQGPPPSLPTPTALAAVIDPNGKIACWHHQKYIYEDARSILILPPNPDGNRDAIAEGDDGSKTTYPGVCHVSDLRGRKFITCSFNGYSIYVKLYTAKRDGDYVDFKGGIQRSWNPRRKLHCSAKFSEKGDGSVGSAEEPPMKSNQHETPPAVRQ